MRCRIAVASLGLFAAAPARAEHQHGYATSDGSDELSAGVTLEAASYDSGDYIGSYQGAMPSVGWAHGRFGASAAIGLYHLEKNGLDTYGAGDAMVTARATLVELDDVRGGVALHVMMPTGSSTDGLGMGHWMFMPSAWAAWQRRALTVAASAGYSRAAVSLDGAHHDHGPMPLVDPMNLQELAWTAGAELVVGAGVRVAARALGGAPIGSGRTRVIGGGRVGWGSERISTGIELQLGLAGDPFSVRGVVDTALRF